MLAESSANPARSEYRHTLTTQSPSMASSSSRSTPYSAEVRLFDLDGMAISYTRTECMKILYSTTRLTLVLCLTAFPLRGLRGGVSAGKQKYFAKLSVFSFLAFASALPPFYYSNRSICVRLVTRALEID